MADGTTGDAGPAGPREDDERDPAPARTRDRLHRTILEMAAQWPVTELTVTAVAATARVHRSSFYVHASSPVDLLQQALTAELDVVRAEMFARAGTDVVPAVRDVTRTMMQHIAQHRAIYRRGLGPNGAASGLGAMLAAHFTATGKQLRELEMLKVDVTVEGVEADLVAEAAGRFIAYGAVGVIAAWVDWSDSDADELSDTFFALIPEWWPRSLGRDWS